MNRSIVPPVVLLVVAMGSGSVAASARPDFWYVVSNEGTATVRFPVRGIVVPDSVTPDVHTGPEGSAISWSRPDGTRQSFVVEGVSSFTFEPGPLDGTTYVPFVASQRMGIFPDNCCACASWLNMVESFERKTCISGCVGCGCEACICSETVPCPAALPGGWALVPNDDPQTVLTIDPSKGVAIGRRGRDPVRFEGAHVRTSVSSEGLVEIGNPESITLPGPITTKSATKGDRARFAWSTPDAVVLAEQPRDLPAPRLVHGMVEFGRPALAVAAKRMGIDPDAAICRICGTHPNSDGDFDNFECVPGSSLCYRCISWGCDAPQI